MKSDQRRLFRSGLAAAAVWVAMLVGCGEDSPSFIYEGGPVDDSLLGRWRVLTHTLNEAGCEAEGPELGAPDSIWFDRRELGFVSYVDCSDAGKFCMPPNWEDFHYTLSLPGEVRGARGVSYASSSGLDDCSLHIDTSYAVITGTFLRIETTWQLLRGFDGPCDPVEAAKRLETIPCGAFEVLTATRSIDVADDPQ